jgi:tetratricopeptide (TPR) repeat protein
MSKHYWWHRYAPFLPKDERALYPHPGEVVTYYRQQQKKDVAEVAAMLHLGEKMVGYHMEKLGIGLDQITHCRELSVYLNIPAELLGLDSLHTQEVSESPWWIEDGFPPFEAGKDGYPKPGQVIKYYRLQKFSNAAYKQEWTQAGLAETLSLTEFTVRRMENQHQHLETMSRRRLLSFLLDIPPVLLGLDSLSHASLLKLPPTPRSITLNTEELAQHRVQLERIWRGYYSNHGQEAQKRAIAQINDLQEANSFVTSEQRGGLLEIQALYRSYLADTAREQADYRRVFSQANQVVLIGQEIENKELTAMALIRRGAAYRERGDYQAAAADIDGAFQLIKHTHVTLREVILVDVGRITAYTAQDKSDRDRAFDFLKEAGALARTGQIDEDPYFLNFNLGSYHHKQAQAYLAIGKRFSSQRKIFLQDACNELALARQLTPLGFVRRHALINLAQAQVYFSMGEYPQAVTLALEALPVFKQIKSTLNLLQIASLYNDLSESSYSTSPRVARLGWELSGAGMIAL